MVKLFIFRPIATTLLAMGLALVVAPTLGAQADVIRGRVVAVGTEAPLENVAVTATSRSATFSSGSFGTSDAVWPSAPSPRCARSSTGGVPATC